MAIWPLAPCPSSGMGSGPSSLLVGQWAPVLFHHSSGVGNGGGGCHHGWVHGPDDSSMSTCSHSNLTLCSTLTLTCQASIHGALCSWSQATHCASLALPLSLKLVGSCTQAFCPHLWATTRLGLCPVSASYGVTLSSTLVDVQFFSQTMYIRASAQIPWGAVPHGAWPKHAPVECG